MVQVVMNGIAGGHHVADKLAANGKPPPPSPEVSNTSKINGDGTEVDGHGVGNKGNGMAHKAGGARKLTKNEKRRQKNKQRRAEAQLGDATEKTMLESNGVTVASWPPPEESKPTEGTVQVRIHFKIILRITPLSST